MKRSDGVASAQIPSEWDLTVQDWSIAARAALLDVATTYDRHITYSQLAKAVQSATGVRTSKPLNQWIGKVLRAVAKECLTRDELLLTALCVKQNGTVGDGFADAAGDFLNGAPPADPELYAAEVRLLCYQKYATDLPADGGQPNLPSQVAARRKAAAPEPSPAMCPVHHTTLPKSGQCDEC